MIEEPTEDRCDWNRMIQGRVRGGEVRAEAGVRCVNPEAAGRTSACVRWEVTAELSTEQ